MVPAFPPIEVAAADPQLTVAAVRGGTSGGSVRGAPAVVSAPAAAKRALRASDGGRSRRSGEVGGVVGFSAGGE